VNVTTIPPTTIVIFGASGDLTQRKLVPALFHLYRKGRLSDGIRIVGFARRPYTDEEFRASMREGIEKLAGGVKDEAAWSRFAPALHYVKGDLERGDDYRKLEQFLNSVDPADRPRLYYLATAPEYYPSSVAYLGVAGMADQRHGRRNIIIEKPFGRDLASAKNLNAAVHAVFDEGQVYRIDHYLGKETAQNILYFRFANTIWEPVWNRRYIDHVQITVAETGDIGRRAGYYDKAGVVRDMFQNHLLQLLCLIAMEPPASFQADMLRNEKVKVLSAIRPVDPADTVRAQYNGYRKHEGVANESRTATYAAIKLYIDNWRWKGVPFYLRSGKAMKERTSEIGVHFQSPPHVMFDLPPGEVLASNMLSVCIQPDEGIHLQFEAKIPGSAQDTRSVDMEFHYRSSFPDESLPDAYERLLLDALKGDAALFMRADEIESAWRIIDPVISGWESTGQPPLCAYAPGSWGPAEADDLLAKRDRRWRLGCSENHTEVSHEKR